MFLPGSSLNANMLLLHTADQCRSHDLTLKCIPSVRQTLATYSAYAKLWLHTQPMQSVIRLLLLLLNLLMLITLAASVQQANTKDMASSVQNVLLWVSGNMHMPSVWQQRCWIKAPLLLGNSQYFPMMKQHRCSPPILSTGQSNVASNSL